FVRTNAGPLPGLTCWNSTICCSLPSSIRTIPFLKSAVVATSSGSSILVEIFCAHVDARGLGRSRSTYSNTLNYPQISAGGVAALRPVGRDHVGVFDA